ncbi:hypothetical protein M406DRAFT_74522 [Cryphonectria parasitica EP155]|uniref:Nephrocystin 3-like N-terminal domain-containing protein n=1 Tax=Cryphonectria parasitica (strain ATCC 38755 / EP155) TaxID=660469 RepID=A0A9P5CL85_CRYP1|nr:uncharacterized protein M406DRAFT_74522 [Cryphonectria parasitica EP155]KAF3761570.1 hypothetical protein M406DRAFT_74522 [Cryphonectria parasitica EP155]
MATEDGRADLLTAMDIIEFLELAAALSQKLVGGEVPKDLRYTRQEASNELGHFLEDVKSKGARPRPAHDVSKRLGEMETRAVELASALKRPFDEVKPGMPGWDRAALLEKAESQSLAEDVIKFADDFNSWLTTAWQSDDWPTIKTINQIRDDAEDARSRIADDICLAINGICIRLGLPYDKLTEHIVSSTAVSFSSATTDHAQSASAGVSTQQKGHQKGRPNSNKKKRQKRQGRGSKPAAGSSSSTNSAVKNPLRSDSFLKSQDILEFLDILETLMREAPWELEILLAVTHPLQDDPEDWLDDAAENTYQWLFEAPVDADGLITDQGSARFRARRNLQAWLSEEKGGLLGISGAPGTGKTTLVKLLAHHPKTVAELQKWAGAEQLIIVPYYFSNTGNIHQKTQIGFCRTVFAELLRQCPTLTHVYFPPSAEASKTKEGKNMERCTTSTGEPWPVSDEHLAVAWNHLTRGELHGFRVCIFVDGLDEYVESAGARMSDLANALQIMANTSECIKICISATRTLDELLGNPLPYSSIHLTALLREDIKWWATAEILSMTEAEKLCPNGDKLISLLVRKSRINFLWVRVVLQSFVAPEFTAEGKIRSMTSTMIRDALASGQLIKIVHACPSDLYGLYEHLLKRLNSTWQFVASVMFSLAVHNPFLQRPNALWFSWLQPLLRDLDFPETPVAPFTADEIREKQEYVEEAVMFMTMGLLKLHWDHREPRKSDQFFGRRIHFFHSTVLKFLNSPRGSDFLLESGGTTEAPDIGVRKFTTLHMLSRLRMAEMVLAAKTQEDPKADAHRHRQYASMVQGVMQVEGRKIDGSPYVLLLPDSFMEGLRKDLETTRSEESGSGYIRSWFANIHSQQLLPGDANTPPSFLHLAMYQGQVPYVFACLEDREKFKDAIGGAKSKELNMLLSAFFGTGGHNGLEADLLGLMNERADILGSVTLRSSPHKGLSSQVSRQASVLMVWISYMVFKLMLPGDGFPQPFLHPPLYRERMVRLAEILVYALSQPENVDMVPLSFVLLLKKKREISPAPTMMPTLRLKMPKGKSSEASSSTSTVEKDPQKPSWDRWPIPEKYTKGEHNMTPKQAELANPVHPSGIVLRNDETHYTTLKQLLVTYIDEPFLAQEVYELIPNDLSRTVLHEWSDIYKNELLEDQFVGYECTRVVASDGTVIGEGAELYFRLY